MSEPKVDTLTFKRRVGLIQKKIGAGEFSKADGLLIVVGSSDEENPYQKSTILHNWLLGYEFPATAILITKDKVVFITSAGKAKYLTGIKSSNVEIWTRTKDLDHNKKLFENLIESLSQLKNIGVLPKDKYQGKFMTEWDPIFNEVKPNLELIDVTLNLSLILEIKDDDEFNKLRLAAKSSSYFMDYFQNEMVGIVDEEKKVSHEKLTERVENQMDRDEFLRSLKRKLGSDFDLDQLDWSYTPIIQSGGKYDLKPSALSNTDNLHGGVVISSLGVRYKSYCSNIGRTFLIDPTPEVEKNYDFLLQVQKKVISLLKPDTTASSVYNGTLEFIKSERPDLEKHFVKNVGWLIGLEFKDSSFVLNAKNERVLHDKTSFDITVGFHNLTNEKSKDPKGKTYSILLSDVFKIQDGTTLLTDYAKNRSEVSFYFKEEDSVKKEVDDLNDSSILRSKKDSNTPPETRSSKILKSKLRTETKNHDENDEARQKQIQKELHEKRQREGLQRFSETSAANPNENKVVFKKYDSYFRESQIPNIVRDLRIHVDAKSQSILIPISGRPVPFHINAYKNGSKNEEGEYTYLRLNFNSPGIGGNSSIKEIPYEDDSSKEFLRSITLRSKDSEHMADVFKKISDLKKESVKKEAERKQLADVVEQAKLIEAKPGRLRRLENVFVRPSPDTKRVPGSLSIHENGLRYQSPLRQDSRIDVLFSNIKHLFFQPSKDELIVIIHVHLKTPIMIGKKKTFDVQFYREATDITIDETNGSRRGGKRRYGDDDELEQEQEERKRKALLDKEFKRFGELIAESSNGYVDLDIPFRELGFQGVPFRASSFLMPTRDCLISLIDQPFLVVTLEEIEIAHLERVQFGLKNFDLVFIFKDFSKPSVHVNTIPMEALEDIKSWLTDVDIPYSESTINLNWQQIMKTLQADPKQFFLDGGWSFLAGDSDNDSEVSESEESDFEASDLDPSDEDVQSEEEYSEADSGSDFSGDDDEESEGEDWDELDRKAARADKEQNFD